MAHDLDSGASLLANNRPGFDASQTSKPYMVKVGSGGHSAGSKPVPRLPQLPCYRKAQSKPVDYLFLLSHRPYMAGVAIRHLPFRLSPVWRNSIAAAILHVTKQVHVATRNAMASHTGIPAKSLQGRATSCTACRQVKVSSSAKLEASRL